MAGGKTSPQRISIAERRQKAFSFRKAGATYRAIALKVAEELGLARYDEAQAFRDVSAVLGEAVSKTRLEAEQYRELEVQRLDMAMVAIASQVQRGDLDAIKVWVKLSESRRKLLGLDAPVQVQIEEKLETELNSFLDQLESVLPKQTFTEVLRAVSTIENRSRAAGAN